MSAVAPLPRSNLETALSLAEELGLPVLPCRRTDEWIVVKGKRELRKAKSPFTDRGFYDATRNVEQITTWWTEHPDALVGVPTGAASGLFVIDVDPRGADWYSNHSDRLDARRVHRTQRGHHLLYHACGLECSSGALADGVDTRGDGGYIIWWPAEGLPIVGEIEDIAPPPEWVKAALQAAAARKRDRPASDGGIGSDRSRDKSASPIGERAVTSDGGIGSDRSRDLLARVGRDIRAGLADYEILAKHRDHPHAREQSDPARAVQRCIDLARSEPVQTGEERRSPLRSLSQILADTTPTKLLLEDAPLLEEYVLALFYGDLGTFKSFIVLWIAARLAEAGIPSVYFTAEGRGTRKRWLGYLRHRYPEHDPREIAAELPFYAIEVPLDLSAPSAIERAKEWIDAAKVELKFIVIDTLARYAGPLDIDTGRDSAVMIQRCDELRVSYRATVGLVAHTGHTAKDRARGSYNLMASTDAHYQIERPVPTVLAAKVTTGRLKDLESPPPFGLRAIEVETGEQDYRGQPEKTLVMVPSDLVQAGRKPPTGRQQAKLLAELERRYAAGERTWTTPQIREMARDLDMHRNTARDAEVGLTTGGWLRHSVGGRTLAYVPEECTK